MRNEISANRRVLSFIVAFAIILSGFTNLITDYSYADSTKYKTVRIDGKEVDIKNADFNAQYDKEYEKTLKELQQSGYKTVNTKFDTKTETILSNSTSPEGNKKGKYLLEKQKWYWQTSWLSNASSGGNAEYTALIGLKNSITGETVNAYCIDLFTFLKNGSNYNNEYIELLEYNQNAFKGNADKLRTIALNSFPNKSLSELRKISGVDDLTEKEAVRASQYLIWSKAHGLNFQELYINNQDYGMGMKKSDKDYVLLSPQASSAAQTKANSARIYKLIQALDSIPVESQKTSVAEPKIDIRKVNFERNTNITDIKVSFEYKFDGENEDKTPLSQDFKYYVGDVELNASDIKNITYTGLTDGYNLVEFYLSPDNFKNNEDLKISVKAMQKIKIINALFSTTNNNKDTQTVITTQNIDSLRSVIKEATISSKENTDKYTVSFKKVDKDELDKASDNSNLSSALEGSKLQLLDYKNTPVNTVTTDTKGLAVFSNLRAGAYTLKEIEAPANYEKISEDMKVLVKEDGKVFIQANNTVYSSDEFILPIPNKVSQVQENIDFTVKKVWLNPLNKPIENHDYKLDIEIYRDGHRIGVKPIGQDGKAVFENMPKLDPATNKPYNYTFEERNASIDIAQFISQERQGNEITFINRLRGGCFNFVKEDEKGEPLAGAVVGVYDARTNRLLFEGTTDSKGKLSNLTNGYQDRIKVDKRIVMELGNYYLKELKAPAGYELNDEKVEFTVEEYTCTPLLKIVNKVSQVQENIDFTVKKVWLNPLNKPIENHDYKLDIEIYRDGHRIGVKPIGQDGKVVFENMPKLDPATNKPYNYTFEERNASIDIAQFISQERQGNEITFINRLRGGCFNFVKEDEKGAPLAGAVVGVYDARTNKLLFEGTTDSEGKLDNLTNGYQERIKVDKRIVMELGNYYLKELKAPAGYELSDEKVEFTVEEYTCTPLLKIVNQKTQEEKLTLVVEKIWQDVTGTPIKDNNYEVTIEIYQDGNKIGEKKIIGNSTIEFDNLPKLDPKTNKPYNYEFKEKDPTVESTSVSKDTIGNKTTIVSKLSSGELDFTKTEFSTDKAVAGATITIYRQNNDEIVVQGITDEQGKINNATVGANRIKNGKIVLEIGQYYFIETNAPKGYVLNDSKQPFEIKKDTVEKAKFENKKEQTQDTNIDFTVKKVWLNPLNKPIENHDYKLDIEIYRDGHRIGVKPIGQDGKVVFENMPKLDPATNKPYNYTFEERNASIDIAQFISQERQGNEITFTNRLRGGCFDFVKQDELGAPLAGAVVGVYDAKTDKLLFEGTTNDQGKLDNLTNGYQDRIKVDRRIVMELGNYYLKELKAPAGYELSDEKVEFTVNEYTCTPLLKIINRQTTGFATIINKDGSTQKPIPNGVFDIYKNVNGQPSGPAIKIGLLIPESGTTIQLPYGDYIAVLVSPPTGGYELPNLIYDRYFTFTVDSSNTQNNPREVIVYHNKPSGPVNPTTSPVLYVTTIDEMRNPIGGATVEIYKKGETTPIIGGNTNIYGKLEEDSAYGSQKGNIQPDGRIELEFGDYEIKETNAPTGYIGPTDTKYISLTTENMIGIVELINKKDIPTPVLISIIVNEKWINIESGKTSDDYKATVKLIRNGIEIDTVIITGDNSHTFDNLPKQDNNGQDYVYEVVQQLESGTREVSKTKQGEYVFDFVNEPMPSTAKGEVIVKYIVVDENGNPTGVVLSEEKLTGDVGVPYNTQQKEFDNYTFVKVDETKGPKSGEFKAQVQEVVYEYKQKSSNGGGGTNPPATKGTVKVSYIVVDENGNPTGETLEGPTVLTGEIGTAYNTVQKVFAGYEFVRVNPNKAPATGNFETTEQEVVYEYKKLPSIEGKVTVKYIVVDEKGNPTGQVLEGPTTIAGVVGTSYTTEQKSFTNYVFVRVNPDKAPATGNFETTEQEVVYEYKKVPSGQSKVTIKYIVIDENGNPTSQILEQTELIGTVGQQYITVQKDFTGYRFVKVDDTKAGVSGNFKVIDQEVIYQYKALGKVTIKYIVIDSNNNPTGQVLEGPTTITGEIGTAYNAEQKTFNGYTFVRVNPDKSTQNGNFKTTEQEVVFEYRVSTSGGSSSGGGGTGGTGGPSNSGNTNTTDNSTTQQSPRARIISEIVGTGNRSDSFNVSEEEVPKSTPKIEIIQEEVPKSVPDKIIRSLEDDNVPKSAPIMVSEVKSNNQPRLPKTGENNTTAMGFALLGLGLISLIKRRKTN